MCSTYTYTCTIIQVGKRTIHIITQAHVVHINRCHAYSCVDYTFFQSVLISPHTLRQAVSSEEVRRGGWGAREGGRGLGREGGRGGGGGGGGVGLSTICF